MSVVPQVRFEDIPGMKRTIETDSESHDGREQDFLTFVNAKAAGQPRPITVKQILDWTDEFSYNNDFLISIGYQKAAIFADKIREYKPKTFIELGGYLGYSALLAAETMREYAPEAHVWSVEMDETCAKIMSEIIALTALKDAITVVRASSTNAITEMQAKDAFKGVDMLFLDHHEPLYLEDLNLYLEKGVIGTGAVVLADNVIKPGAPDFLAHVRNHAGLKSAGIKCLITPLNIEDELEVTKILDAKKALEA